METDIAFPYIQLCTGMGVMAVAKAQFTPEQAEGLADAMSEVMQGDIATKSDIAALRAEIREAELRLRAEISAVRTDIAGVKNDTIRWIFGLVGFQTVAMIGAVLALARTLAH